MSNTCVDYLALVGILSSASPSIARHHPFAFIERERISDLGYYVKNAMTNAFVKFHKMESI